MKEKEYKFESENAFWDFFDKNPELFPEGRLTEMKIILENANSYGDTIIFYSPIQILESGE